MEEDYGDVKSILHLIHEASKSLSLEWQIDLALSGLCSATGAEHGMLCIVDESGTVGTFFGDVDAFPPAADRVLRNMFTQPFPIAHATLLQRAIITKKPVEFHSARRDTDPDVAEVAGKWSVQSAMVIPFVMEERVIAGAVLFSLSKPMALSEDKRSLAMDMSRALAPALANALLHQRVKQIAIVEERTRLAQELHDDLAQLIGAMQLKASLAEEKLNGGDLAGTQALLAELQETLDQAYKDVREVIFNLRVARTAAGTPLLPAIQEYLDDLRRFYAFDVALESKGAVRAALDEHARLQIIRIIQEGLNNARKHARASAVWLRVTQDEDALRICVRDDGVGFDLAGVEEGRKNRFGLQVMRERAASIGATISVYSLPGKGTRLTLELPLSARKSSR